MFSVSILMAFVYVHTSGILFHTKDELLEKLS
jgi:hypothetical protein